MSLPYPPGDVVEDRRPIRAMLYDLPCSYHKWRGTLHLRHGLWNLPWWTSLTQVGGALFFCAVAYFWGFREDIHLFAAIACGACAGVVYVYWAAASWRMAPEGITVHSAWEHRMWWAEDLHAVMVVDQTYSATTEGNFRAQGAVPIQARMIGKGILLRFADGEQFDMGGSADIHAVHRIAYEIGRLYDVSVDDPDQPDFAAIERQARWLNLLLASFLAPIAIAIVILIFMTS